MDGPRITLRIGSDRILQVLASLEKRIYDSMPCTDNCIVFDVPLNVALTRNSSREIKEDEEGLIRRFNENKDPAPICLKRVVFDNSEDLSLSLKRFRSLYWRLICDSQP